MVSLLGSAGARMGLFSSRDNQAEPYFIYAMFEEAPIGMPRRAFSGSTMTAAALLGDHTV